MEFEHSKNTRQPSWQWFIIIGTLIIALLWGLSSIFGTGWGISVTGLLIFTPLLWYLAVSTKSITGQVVAVLFDKRTGAFYAFKPPGTYWLPPTKYTVKGFIPTGFQSVMCEFRGRAGDAVDVDVGISIAYNIRPFTITTQNLPQMAYTLAKSPTGQHLINSCAKNRIRLYLQKYDAAVLCSHGAFERIQGDIERNLKKTLSPLGINIAQVNIEKLDVPRNVRRTLSEKSLLDIQAAIEVKRHLMRESFRTGCAQTDTQIEEMKNAVSLKSKAELYELYETLSSKAMQNIVSIGSVDAFKQSGFQNRRYYDMLNKLLNLPSANMDSADGVNNRRSSNGNMRRQNGNQSSTYYRQRNDNVPSAD